MPRFDCPGPLGWGPRVGRGLGFCGSPPRAAFCGYGRGFGRGYGRRQRLAPSKEAIKDEISFLEERLEELRELLAEDEDKE
ncbi:MAG: DUF5320 domain-containing protein [Firmicutes bacterium]|nr:DUF5320 domain-containing protein [Bacillota bacterium]